MVKVLLHLDTAISAADRNLDVRDFVTHQQAYLVSVHTILAGDNPISTWGLNYYSPELDKAKTFEVSQDIGELKIRADQPSELSEKDLKKLDLAGTLPIQDLVDKAFEKKKGKASNVIISASHTEKRKSPILRVNFVSSQLFIQSIILSLKSGRILSNKTDNISGTRVVAGTVNLRKD